MDNVGGSETSAGSESAATLVLAAMSSALVSAATSASLLSRSAKAGSRGDGSQSQYELKQWAKERANFALAW